MMNPSLHRTTRGLVFLLIMFCLTNVWPVWAGEDADGGLPAVLRDIVYYDGPEFYAPRHILDVYLPSGGDTYPVLMFIHGGSWTSGNKNGYGYLGNAFASAGFITVIANYRLTDSSPGRVVHPGHVEDVARAFAWTYANIADYGGNPENIFISGHSAGGHLVALLALDPQYLAAQGLLPDAIKGVIGVSGVYDVTAPISTFTVPFGSTTAQRRAASPTAHVGDYLAPPMQLLYGSNNYPGLGLMAVTLNGALLGMGFESEVQEFPGRTHITMISRVAMPDDEVAAAMLRFLNGHL